MRIPANSRMAYGYRQWCGSDRHDTRRAATAHGCTCPKAIEDKQAARVRYRRSEAGKTARNRRDRAKRRPSIEERDQAYADRLVKVEMLMRAGSTARSIAWRIGFNIRTAQRDMATIRERWRLDRIRRLAS